MREEGDSGGVDGECDDAVKGFCLLIRILEKTWEHETDEGGADGKEQTSLR